jgi:hypothetical protein
MPEIEKKQFMIEGAQIIFRNFAGKIGPYNDKGDREFSVIIPPELLDELIRDNWNVKYLESREEGEPDIPFISVRVNFKQKPPRVVMLTATSRTSLNEDSVEVLDYADIANADLICRGYEWEVNGKSGTKAYLQSLFVTIEEDELERKYAINEPGMQAQ